MVFFLRHALNQLRVGTCRDMLILVLIHHRTHQGRLYIIGNPIGKIKLAAL